MPSSEITSSPVPVQRWRPVGPMAIEVNFDAPVELPFGPLFDGAKIQWNWTKITGWVRVERIGDDVFVGGLKVVFHLEPEQAATWSINGYVLQLRVEDKSVLDPRIGKALFENQHLLPDSWKVDADGNIRSIFFWSVGFRGRGSFLSVQRLCLRCGQWCWDNHWLVNDWRAWHPAAVLEQSDEARPVV